MSLETWLRKDVKPVIEDLYLELARGERSTDIWALIRDVAETKCRNDRNVDVQKAFLAIANDITQLATIAERQPWALGMAVNNVNQRTMMRARGLTSQATIVRTRGVDPSSAESTGDDYADSFPDILNQPAPAKWLQGSRKAVNVESLSGFELPRYGKSDEEISRLLTYFEHCFLFDALQNDQCRRRLVECLKPMTVKMGFKVVTEGDSGDGMYFLEEGEIDLIKNDNNRFKKVNQPGQSFGEAAVIHRCNRVYTAEAMTDCVLWFLDRMSYNYIMRQAAGDLD